MKDGMLTNRDLDRMGSVIRESVMDALGLRGEVSSDPRAIFDRDKREAQGVRCGNCRYWKPKIFDDEGECVRSHPVPSNHASTYLDHWCGDFERDTSAGPTPPPRRDQASEQSGAGEGVEA